MSLKLDYMCSDGLDYRVFWKFDFTNFANLPN